MAFRILIFILFLKINCLYSQADSLPVSQVLDKTVNIDSLLKEDYTTDNIIYPKTIPLNFQDKYTGEDFDYTTVKPKESLWEKLKRRLYKILDTIFGTAPIKAREIGDLIIKGLAITIIAVVLYFLIKFLLSQNGNFIFGKKNRKINLNEEELRENIHEINFPESISRFEQQKDFRSAIRYHFLFVLKKLSDNQRIQWNPEKTNKDYVKELQNTDLATDFRQLSYIFDHVWYGEFELDEGHYINFKKQFSGFSVSRK
ncbi:MAG: DUF4129 domain-containing protein [Cruoricaptor ignavus]|nr:DUF4129 domain-containing protein [Cruoricaptor ignavus]